MGDVSANGQATATNGETQPEPQVPESPPDQPPAWFTAWSSKRDREINAELGRLRKRLDTTGEPTPATQVAAVQAPAAAAPQPASAPGMSQADLQAALRVESLKSRLPEAAREAIGDQLEGASFAEQERTLRLALALSGSSNGSRPERAPQPNAAKPPSPGERRRVPLPRTQHEYLHKLTSEQRYALAEDPEFDYRALPPR